jgi:hypothetical protein
MRLRLRLPKVRPKEYTVSQLCRSVVADANLPLHQSGRKSFFDMVAGLRVGSNGGALVDGSSSQG